MITGQAYSSVIISKGFVNLLLIKATGTGSFIFGLENGFHKDKIFFK